MADQFKPGDVVALKSGGPLMTVVKYGEYNGERKVSCEWFDSKEVFVIHLGRAPFTELHRFAGLTGM